MKRTAFRICAFLVVIALSVGCGSFRHPNNYPNSRWVCKNPYGELIILEREKRKAPNEKNNKLTMKINGEEKNFAFTVLANFDKGGAEYMER